MGGSGVLDYAGGTVVHINAGIAGLVACIIVGKHVGYSKKVKTLRNMALTLTGAAMRWWFGWFANTLLGIVRLLWDWLQAW